MSDSALGPSSYQLFVSHSPGLGFVSPPRVSNATKDRASNSPAVAAARCVVVDYLRDIGLRDPDLVARESLRIVQQAQRELSAGDATNETLLCEAAIQLTVKQLKTWLGALSVDGNAAADPDQFSSVLGARLPALLNRYPEALNQHLPPEEIVDHLRMDLTPVVPKPRPKSMRQQRLNLLPSSIRRLLKLTTSLVNGQEVRVDPESAPATVAPALSRMTASRLTLMVLTVVSTVLATILFSRVIAADGLGLIDFPLAALFTLLFVWVAFSFWTATLGLVSILRQPRKANLADAIAADSTELPATAILMPVYNEEPTNVFANLRAIVQSLHATGRQDAFSIFVLSDTTNPDIWLKEERAWAKLVAGLPCKMKVFYRHRPNNTSRKVGNIADFCSRWGDHYKYMIVLDADSLMAGETLVEMVRRMEHDPKIGILQVPPTPVNRQSMFARIQQFAARVYGPVFLEGFSLWSQCDGNYWGHNAIIRVQPFMEHCDLPILPGQGPLSGEILSHDFVEAALIRRAGWKVCLAHDLDGSYEECPTTMLDFAQRDQRWCQGNMQHIRLLLAEGLHPASRLHLGMGAMSYLASPLWLAFLLLTVLGAVFGGDLFVAGQSTPSGLTLFVVTMSMLLLPKLWGVIALCRQPKHDAAQGVWNRVLVGVLVESLVSMLIAPIMMLLQTRFVIATLMGRKVTWNAQNRDDRGVRLEDAIAVHYPHLLIGLAVTALIWAAEPGLLPWLSPVVAGLTLAIPLSMLLGSVKIGKWLAQAKILLIPEEVSPPPVVSWQRAAIKRADAETTAASTESDPFVWVLRDPTFYAMHVGILRATDGEVPMPVEQVQSMKDLLTISGPKAVPATVRRAILNDPKALETLHTCVRSRPAPASPTLQAEQAW